MTAAGRPTWNAAIGTAIGSEGGARVYVPSRSYSVRDVRAHTKLKVRQPGQNAPEEVKKRDLRQKLEERERKSKKKGEDQEERDEEETRLLTQGKKEEAPKSIDADDSDDSDSDSSSESSSDSESDDDDDETAELMKELERIKKEREEEARRKEAEAKKVEAQEREQQMLTSNPLISAPRDDFNIKKRWYEDTVFKNQARGEAKMQKRFINDTIRNDFHKKFLNKYIK